MHQDRRNVIILFYYSRSGEASASPGIHGKTAVWLGGNTGHVVSAARAS